MEIRNLITFVQVAELGSFTRAAKALDYSQSTVSFQIKQLETELDCLLFERINHTLSLTQKGQELLSYAQKVLRLTDEFHESLSESGQVTDGAGCGMIKRKRRKRWIINLPADRRLWM